MNVYAHELGNGGRIPHREPCLQASDLTRPDYAVSHRAVAAHAICKMGDSRCHVAGTISISGKRRAAGCGMAGNGLHKRQIPIRIEADPTTSWLAPLGARSSLGLALSYKYCNLER